MTSFYFFRFSKIAKITKILGIICFSFCNICSSTDLTSEYQLNRSQIRTLQDFSRIFDLTQLLKDMPHNNSAPSVLILGFQGSGKSTISSAFSSIDKQHLVEYSTEKVKYGSFGTSKSLEDIQKSPSGLKLNQDNFVPLEVIPFEGGATGSNLLLTMFAFNKLVSNSPQHAVALLGVLDYIDAQQDRSRHTLDLFAILYKLSQLNPSFESHIGFVVTKYPADRRYTDFLQLATDLNVCASEDPKKQEFPSGIWSDAVLVSDITWGSQIFQRAWDNGQVYLFSPFPNPSLIPRHQGSCVANLLTTQNIVFNYAESQEVMDFIDESCKIIKSSLGMIPKFLLGLCVEIKHNKKKLSKEELSRIAYIRKFSDDLKAFTHPSLNSLANEMRLFQLSDPSNPQKLQQLQTIQNNLGNVSNLYQFLVNDIGAPSLKSSWEDDLNIQKSLSHIGSQNIVMQDPFSCSRITNCCTCVCSAIYTGCVYVCVKTYKFLSWIVISIAECFYGEN